MKVEEMGAKTLSIATDSASIFTFGSAKPLAESFRFSGARPCGAPGFPLQFAASRVFTAAKLPLCPAPSLRRQLISASIPRAFGKVLRKRRLKTINMRTISFKPHPFLSSAEMSHIARIILAVVQFRVVKPQRLYQRRRRYAPVPAVPVLFQVKFCYRPLSHRVNPLFFKIPF